MPWFQSGVLKRVDTRVIVAVYLVIMVVMVALTLEATKREEAAVKEDMLHHSHALSEALEAVIVDPLYYRDVDKIKDIITRVAREEPRVLYIYVLDSKGRVLADTEGGKYLRIIFDDEIGRKALDATDLMPTYTPEELVVTHPIILRDKIGSIRMGVSLEKMKENVAKIYFRNIMVMMALFLVSIPPIYLVIRREISDPMDELIRAVTDLKKGNLRARTRIKTDSEMDVLAKSFNEMADSLEKNSKELYKAYNELKSLDELKRNIITNVSHELRTPITIAKAALELVRSQKDHKRRDELLKIVYDAFDRQNRIIVDLIEAAKMESTKMEFKMEPVNLLRIVEKLKAEFEPLLIKDKLKMRVLVEGSLPTVKADRKNLVHVLRNLIGNAIKFNKEEGSVTVEALQKGDMVEVFVSDTGIGIQEDKQDKIFKRFYQVDGGITRRYGGIGMGLAIVKEIIEAHGGMVKVESELGRGSKFYITLPVWREKKG